MGVMKSSNHKNPKNAITSKIFDYEGEWVLISRDGQKVLAHAKDILKLSKDIEKHGENAIVMPVPLRNAIQIFVAHGI